MRRDIFKAIADPTRRAIIQLLANQTLNLNTVADNFEISRPAISKHIKILTECGLVIIRKRGRERFCEANLDHLKEITSWVEKYHNFWSEKLNSLDKYLNNPEAEKKVPYGRKKLLLTKKSS